MRGKLIRNDYLQRFKSIEQRFKEQLEIAKNGCWIWLGCRDKDGYGVIRIKGKNIRAHRYSYKKYIGSLLVKKCVCHTCDNPSCVNPKHLWLGTNKENLQDRNNKGRWNPKRDSKSGKFIRGDYERN